MINIDPQIPISYAAELAGDQQKLAALLGLKRSNVSMWKKKGLDILPPLHGYRFWRLYPEHVQQFIPQSKELT